MPEASQPLTGEGNGVSRANGPFTTEAAELAETIPPRSSSFPSPANVPLSLELSPDFRVLAFALCTALLTGLIFGLAPALKAARQDITSRLRSDSPGAGRAGHS